MEQCTQEDKINKLERSVVNIEKVLWKGNGKPSIMETLVELHTTMKTLTSNQEQTAENSMHLTTAINGLLRFQESVESDKRVREEYGILLENQRKKTRWAIGVLVTICLAFVSFISVVVL